VVHHDPHQAQPGGHHGSGQRDTDVEVLPAMRRTLMRKGKAPPEEFAKLQKRETRLIRISFILSALILAATAFARAS